MKKVHLLMLALQSFLSSCATPFTLLRAEFSAVIEDLENRLGELNTQMSALQAKADAEHRSLTTDEEKFMSDSFAEFEATEAEIDRRNRLTAAQARLAAGRGRQTDPAPLVGDDPAARPRVANRSRTPITAEPAFARDAGKWGFRSFGEFSQAVHVACLPGAQMDPRLVMAAGPTTPGSEGIGSDGGFAVPPDFRTEIVEKVMGEDSLLSRTDQLTSSGNSITIPKDETTPWQGTGGIQAYWENELAAQPQSKPALEQMTVRLNKLTALVPVSDELLEDAPALSTYLRRKAPMKIDFRISDAIINGTGVGQPLGLLNSGAKIKIAKEGSQTNGTIVFNNVVKMYAQLYAGCRSNAVWLVNQDVEPQLLGMQFPGTGTAVPVYLPPGGLSGAQYGSLFGKPVIATEACQALGTEGDLILTDLKTYLTATKVGGIKQDVSIHLYFDYGATAFRFVIRIGGQSWWNNSITPKNGSNQRGNIITLAGRP